MESGSLWAITNIWFANLDSCTFVYGNIFQCQIIEYFKRHFKGKLNMHEANNAYYSIDTKWTTVTELLNEQWQLYLITVCPAQL